MAIEHLPDLSEAQDVPTFRAVEDIQRDIRRVPATVAELRDSIGHHRRMVQVAFSRWDETTDLRAERDRLIDKGLQVAEEEAVSTAERMITQLQQDVATMTGAAPTLSLLPSEEQALVTRLPIVAEQAAHMPGDAIIREIEGALLRRDRVALAAWTTVADRIRARRDLPIEQRTTIGARILNARPVVMDFAARSAISDAERAIADLETFVRTTRSHANEVDEIPNTSPLYQYKFGRRPVDASGAREYSRPKATERWFRQRAGLHVSVEE